MSEKEAIRGYHFTHKDETVVKKVPCTMSEANKYLVGTRDTENPVQFVRAIFKFEDVTSAYIAEPNLAVDTVQS